MKKIQTKEREVQNKLPLQTDLEVMKDGTMWKIEPHCSIYFVRWPIQNLAVSGLAVING